MDLPGTLCTQNTDHPYLAHTVSPHAAINPYRVTFRVLSKYRTPRARAHRMPDDELVVVLA